MHSVAVLATNPMSSFETSVAVEVFGLDRSDMGVPRYQFGICALTPGPVPVKWAGVSMHVPNGIGLLRRADTLIFPAWPDFDEPVPLALLETIRRAHRRGARLVSFCSGAFVLASTGLLDGRRMATHWMHAGALAERFPRVEVDESVLFVDDGSGLFTSAGTAAAIDLCLHLVRQDHGAEIAGIVARRMVTPPHRDGGQAQFVPSPVRVLPRVDPVASAMAWALERLDTEITVERLAEAALQSTRTFARRFRAANGTTPLQWLLRQRVMEAQRLLETTDLSIEQVAQRCGFGAAATLRLHFGRIVGVAPAVYRRRFTRAS
jgi:transcriptional regulator GlxA family with amidase domain